MKKIGINSGLVLLAVILFSGCCKKTYPTKTIIYDTVQTIRTVRVRDTLFQFPGAQVGMMLPGSLFHAKGAKAFRKERKEKQAHLSVVYIRDTLKIECKCDTMAIEAKLRDSIIRTERKKTTVNTKVVEQKYVPWWVKTLAWIGGVSLGLIILVIVLEKITGLKLW